MLAQSAKQEAIEVISHLPDDVPLDEIVYRLNLMCKIHHGMQDIRANRIISSEDLTREIEHW